MASTQLADVYVPEPFESAVDEAAIEMNRFIQSGILAGDATIDAMAATGGKTGVLPYYNPLDTSTEPNYSSDNPASAATPDKITSGEENYRKSMMNNGWSTMDLTRELALSDPLGAITSKIGKYWAVQQEKRVLAAALGVLADNETNDTSDMVNNIYEDLILGSLDADNYVQLKDVLDAKQTLGDHGSLLTTIVMHSVVYNNLAKAQEITTVSGAGPSGSDVTFATYAGLRVIVDDSMTVTAGSNTPSYLSMLFAPGVFAFGSGGSGPLVASELERVPSQGDGGGQDIIWSRRSEIIHPYGFDMTGTPAADSATLAELAAATSWDRKRDRKNIGIAFLRSNG